MAACEAISTADAPLAMGAYSQAVRAGNFLFLSGQLGIDPITQKLVVGGIEAEIRQIFSNLQAVTLAGGGHFNDMVKLTVYLKDLKHFPILNEMMKDYFSEPYPARATVEISDLAAGALIEIDGIVALNKS